MSDSRASCRPSTSIAPASCCTSPKNRPNRRTEKLRPILSPIIEYSRSTMVEVSGFHPTGKRRMRGASKFSVLTLTPMRTPKTLKEIPAAQTRRSSLSIHGDFHLTIGRPDPATLISQRKVFYYLYIFIYDFAAEFKTFPRPVSETQLPEFFKPERPIDWHTARTVVLLQSSGV